MSILTNHLILVPGLHHVWIHSDQSWCREPVSDRFRARKLPGLCKARIDRSGIQWYTIFPGPETFLERSPHFQKIFWEGSVQNQKISGRIRFFQKYFLRGLEPSMWVGLVENFRVFGEVMVQLGYGNWCSTGTVQSAGDSAGMWTCTNYRMHHYPFISPSTRSSNFLLCDPFQ